MIICMDVTDFFFPDTCSGLKERFNHSSILFCPFLKMEEATETGVEQHVVPLLQTRECWNIVPRKHSVASLERDTWFPLPSSVATTNLYGHYKFWQFVWYPGECVPVPGNTTRSAIVTTNALIPKHPYEIKVYTHICIINQTKQWEYVSKPKRGTIFYSWFGNET
jgi:hypothetical protein